MGAVAFFVAAFALWKPLLETWHLYRLDSRNERMRKSSAEALARLGSKKGARAVAAIFEKTSHAILSKDTELASRLRLEELTTFSMSIPTEVVEALKALRTIHNINFILSRNLVNTLQQAEPKVTVSPSPNSRPVTEVLDLILEQLPGDAVYTFYDHIFIIGPANSARAPNDFLEKQCENLWAGDALVQFGKDAVPELIPMIRHPSPYTRMAAIFALSRIGEDASDAVPELLAILEGESPSLKILSARALGALGKVANAAIPVLKNALREKNFDFRSAAAEAILNIEEGEVPSGKTDQQVQ